MEKVTLTRVAVTDKKKDGTILESEYGKYFRVGIVTKEYGEDVWINGFSGRQLEWAEGDVVELEITKGEWQGREQLNFKIPKKEDVVEAENIELKAKLAKLEGKEETVIDFREEDRVDEKKEELKEEEDDKGAF